MDHEELSEIKSFFLLAICLTVNVLVSGSEDLELISRNACDCLFIFMYCYE